MVGSLVSLFGPTGLQHVGCYYVPRFSNRLGLLEGLTEDLSDDPRTRTNPIRKCGAGAQEFNFNLFAVSTGYCISGSNRLRDYQYVRSRFCNNGVGGFIFGYFVMDVYEIVDTQVFQDSAGIVGPSPSPSPTAVANENGNGSSALSSSIVLLLISVLTTLTCFVLL